jgi:hypothetical protein
LLQAGFDGATASSTFLKASSKDQFIARVAGAGSGTKVLLVPFSTLLAFVNVMPLEASLLATIR